MAYPITEALREALDKDLLLGTLGQAALNYVGEYEHGSVDVTTLLPASVSERETVSDDDDNELWMLTERDLLQFAANVLHDYLLTKRVEEGAS